MPGPLPDDHWQGKGGKGSWSTAAPAATRREVRHYLPGAGAASDTIAGADERYDRRGRRMGTQAVDLAGRIWAEPRAQLMIITRCDHHESGSESM